MAIARVTEKDLRVLVDQINGLTGNPLQAWSEGKANVGNYHLYGANGGISLHQTMNCGGGVHTILGNSTKREMRMQLYAFLHGIRTGSVMHK
jgi:hypothetical protein